MRSSLLVVGLFGLHTKSRLEASLALSNTISATAHAWLKKNGKSDQFPSMILASSWSRVSVEPQEPSSWRVLACQPSTRRPCFLAMKTSFWTKRPNYQTEWNAVFQRRFSVCELDAVNTFQRWV